MWYVWVRRGVYRVLMGKQEGKKHRGDLDVDGLGMWHVWVRRGCVLSLGGETGGKQTTVETEA